MTCEELLVTQAESVKAINPNAKVFVYRNLVKVCQCYATWLMAMVIVIIMTIMMIVMTVSMILVVMPSSPLHSPSIRAYLFLSHKP